MPAIHQFRRDLRLFDNTAFNAAIREGGGGVVRV
jgi:deoxyribodipyrimidine photolyase